MSPTAPVTSQRPPEAVGGRLRSALRVASAALGLAPAGPRAAMGEVEPLRRHLAATGPHSQSVSYLQSTPTETSATGPRMLLIHGTPGSAASWADYLLQPPAAAEVMAIDRPGFGRSGPHEAMPGLDEQAAAVRRLMPAADRPVVLVGHSFGGPVAACLAATLAFEEPLRPVSLVLLAAAMDPALEAVHVMQRLGAWRPVRTILPRVIRNANTELLALKPELEALAALLPAITARVLIVHGTQDDLVPVANVAYMQTRLQNAAAVKTVLLEGRNHFLPWNSEVEVRHAMQQALELVC